MIPTKELAQKVRDTVDAGLSMGKGNPIPGQMCVEAAVNYAMGLPHGDDPSCVGRAVRNFKITLNDSQGWTSNAARAKGLRRVAIAQLGSDKLDQVEFSEALALETIRQILPIALRVVGVHHPRLATEFEALSRVCETATDLAEARQSDKTAANAAARADGAAVEAAHAASIHAAANSTANYAANTASAAASAHADPDKILTLSAEIAVQILIKMGCQGCAWLDLVPLDKN